MKSLKSYITERFTVAGTESNKILLFDIDDTLINSDVKVYVMKDGQLVRKLSSSEFNTYHLKPGEEFDFREFNDEDILNSKSVFLKYWDTLKREYSNGVHIGIITARSNAGMFHRFFKNNGIDIKRELIFAVNDPSLRLKGDTIEAKKADAIKRLAHWGYTTFVFFDDNKDNLAVAKALEQKYNNIHVHTVKV